MEDLERFEWYHGEQDRQICNDILWSSPVNTWMVRVSSTSGRLIISKLSMDITKEPRYSIDPLRSHSFPEASNKKIKHFIINLTTDGQFYLTKGACFRAMPILIDFYRNNPIIAETEPSDQAFLAGPIATKISLRRDSQGIGGDVFHDVTVPRDVAGNGVKSLDILSEVSDMSDDDEDNAARIGRQTQAMSINMIGFSMDDLSRDLSDSGVVHSAPIQPHKAPVLLDPKSSSGTCVKTVESEKPKNPLLTASDLERTKVRLVKMSESGKPKYPLIKVVEAPTFQSTDSLGSFKDSFEDPEEPAIATGSESVKVLPTAFHQMLSAEVHQCTQEILALKVCTVNLSARLDSLSKTLQQVLHHEQKQQHHQNSPKEKDHLDAKSMTNGKSTFVPNPGTILEAVRSHQPNFFDELTLNVGDRITFLDQVEPGWWRGKSHSKVGVFPSPIVVIVPEDTDKKKQFPRRSIFNS